MRSLREYIGRIPWLALVFLAGLSLRSAQFFGHSSMWFDELTNALNIISHDFVGLVTQSLDHNQVAPLGFLLGEKLAVTTFGEHDMSFRLLPYLWSILSLILFFRVSRIFLSGGFHLGACLIFASSMATWLYAGEGKQYSGDIAASLFLVWSGLIFIGDEKGPVRIWVMSLLGGVLILSSLPAIVMAPSIGAILLYRQYCYGLLRKKDGLFTVLASWGMACALSAAYALFVISPTVRSAMADYWKGGFLPQADFVDRVGWFLMAIKKATHYFLTGWMEFNYKWIHFISYLLLLLSIPGAFWLFKKRMYEVLILLVPVSTATLLAIFSTLPLIGRVAVYSCWPWVILGAAGAAWIGSLSVGRIASRSSAAVVCALGLLLLVLTILRPEDRPPMQTQSAQPVLRELKKRMKPGDILYVYFKSRHALKYYGPKEGITDYVTGGRFDTIEGYLRDLDQLKGKPRVWFFFSQWTERQPFPDSMKTYLGNVIGREIDKIADPYGGIEDMEAAAHLYDISGR